MKAIGVIAEYNPIHKGHAAQIQHIRQTWPTAVIIIVMSGAFVQRGTPAMFSKFDRAKWAIEAGADIVFELPAHFAVASAEHFATGGVRLLDGIGVDTICFGAETTDTNLYDALLALQDAPFLQQHIQSFMAMGATYGVALRKAYMKLAPESAPLINNPNALLGLEYLKAIRKYQLPIQSHIIARPPTYHDTTVNADAPSSTALRALLTKDKIIDSCLLYLAPATIQSIEEALLLGKYVDMKRYYDAVLWQSTLIHKEQLRQLGAFTEGLEDAWKNASLQPTWQRAREELKSKRYTYARLDRMSTYTLAGWTTDTLADSYALGPQYARILACRASATSWLKQSPGKLPFVTKWAPFLKHATTIAATQARADQLLTDLQYRCFHNATQRIGGADFTTSPYVKK